METGKVNEASFMKLFLTAFSKLRDPAENSYTDMPVLC